MRSALFLLIVLPLFGSGCTTLMPPPLPVSAIKPTIAVSSFQNRSGFEGNWNLGTGMAELLLAEVVSSDNFVAVERLELDQIVAEIDRQDGPLFRSEGKVARGNLRGSQFLIRGAITDFSQVSGGSLWVWIKGMLIGGRTSTARVSLTLTIVDVGSGEIVGSVKGTGDAPAYSGYLKANYMGVAFGGDAFFNTPLGEATGEAIRKALYALAVKMPRVYWSPRIAAVMPDRIIISGGASRGIRIGSRFQVRGQAQDVTDPQTGEFIAEVPGIVIGQVRVVAVHEKSAVVEIINGELFERGQWCELIHESPRPPSS